MTPRPPTSPLFPYTTLFRSEAYRSQRMVRRSQLIDSRQHRPPVATFHDILTHRRTLVIASGIFVARRGAALALAGDRSEEHTSELQSQSNLVCRLLLEKKKY